MITKLAFLPRLLPGIFHRSVAATVGSYRMPRDRYFFYGISVSAMLHAAVLAGFNRPTDHGGGLVPAEPRPIPPEVFAVAFDPDEVPEVKEPDTKEEKPPVNDANGAERATLGETFRDPSEHAITVNVDKIAPPVRPDTTRKDWTVPVGPPAGSRVSKDKPWNPVDLDKVPVATSRAAPRYPFEMKREGRSGTVVMRFVVDSRGEVSAVEVISASSPEFAREATAAMARWKFKAGMKDGKRVSTLMEMPMEFSLEKGS